MSRKIPNACFDVGIKFVNAAQACHGKGYGVVGHHFICISWGSANGNIVLSGSLDVYAVVANSRAAYHLQTRQVFKNLSRKQTVRGHNAICLLAVRNGVFGVSFGGMNKFHAFARRHFFFQFKRCKVHVHQRNCWHRYSFLCAAFAVWGQKHFYVKLPSGASVFVYNKHILGTRNNAAVPAKHQIVCIC